MARLLSGAYRVHSPIAWSLEAALHFDSPYCTDGSHATTGEYETASELDLQLFERQFMKGDLVKHALTDLESAVVVETRTECLVEHVISRERLHKWIPWTELKNAVQIEAKDRVVYDEWIGTVEEVSTMFPGLTYAEGRGGETRWCRCCKVACCVLCADA